MRRLMLLASLAMLALVAAEGTAANSVESLVVHEWGTFTSIAGADGRAVEWRPLDQPSELPRFVQRFGYNFKQSLACKVRMETPVIYFYTPREMTVSVNVRFNQGAITEWFPRADVTPSNVAPLSLRRADFSSRISWTDVKLTPSDAEKFPVDRSGSHYYAARRTDASPLQAMGQREKFLFYRGVGGFEPPSPTGRTIFFRNDGEESPPVAEIEQMLIANGLYPKEARAMIETWRDLWFGEGTRLFYIVPRPTIDAILPLEINPRPSEIVRVFVGRIELKTGH